MFPTSLRNRGNFNPCDLRQRTDIERGDITKRVAYAANSFMNGLSSVRISVMVNLTFVSPLVRTNTLLASTT